MILYYAESGLVGHDHVLIPIFTHLNCTDINTGEHTLSNDIYEIYTTPWINLLQVDNENIPVLNLGNNNKTWVLVEQIETNLYVKLYGIKRAGDDIGIPLKIVFYGTNLRGEVINSFMYFQNSIDTFLEGLNFTDSITCKNIKGLLADKFEFMLEKIFDHFDKKNVTRDSSMEYIRTFSLERLQRYRALLSCPVAPNYLCQVLEGKFNDVHLDLLKDVVESLEDLLVDCQAGWFDTEHMVAYKDIICNKVGEMFRSAAPSLPLGKSDLFYLAKQTVMDLAYLIKENKIEIIDPCKFVSNDKIDHIEGDYLLTPNICSSIDNFNFDKYGHMFIDIFSIDHGLLIEIYSITDTITYGVDYTNNIINLEQYDLHSAIYKKFIDFLVLILQQERATEHILDLANYAQLTKTFMGDIIITFFDKQSQFLGGICCSEIVDILNRPTLFYDGNKRR